MRTEIKIGVAVGVLVLLVVGIYVVATRNVSEPPARETATPTLTNHIEIAGGPSTAPSPATHPSSLDVAISPPPAPIPSVPAGPAPSVTVVPAPTVDVSISGHPSGGLGEPAASPFVPTTPTPAVSEPQQTYTVARGDTFYSIAQKKYGNGSKYWDIIQKANPDARADALREGMKLVIPPLPAKPVVPGAPSVSSAAGQAAPGGGTPYVVKADDRGYWTIAEKVYGNGKYWTLIRDANKGVTSESLHAGQTLVIPPKPADASAAGGSNGKPTTRPSGAAAGNIKRYIVQKDDTLIAIAEKEYGDGSRWAKIAAANPQIKDGIVMEGQILTIPPKESTPTSLPAATRTTSSRVVKPKPAARPLPVAPVESGRPDFGPP